MIQLFIDMEKKVMFNLNKVYVKEFTSCKHNMNLVHMIMNMISCVQDIVHVNLETRTSYDFQIM